MKNLLLTWHLMGAPHCCIGINFKDFKYILFIILFSIYIYDFYSACEVGRKDIVKMLLDHKADGRIHPITRYSPLYIVAFKGKKDVVEILLKVLLYY